MRLWHVSKMRAAVAVDMHLMLTPATRCCSAAPARRNIIQRLQQLLQHLLVLVQVLQL